MKKKIRQLKSRIFGLESLINNEQDSIQINNFFVNRDIDTGKFTLAEVLEFLSREKSETKNAFVLNGVEDKKTLDEITGTLIETLNRAYRK